MTERDKLIQILKNDNCPSPMLCSPECKYIDSADCYAERLADMLIENDMIKVVRCRDCANYGKYNFNDKYDENGWCNIWRATKFDHNFCEYGKRREDE